MRDSRPLVRDMLAVALLVLPVRSTQAPPQPASLIHVEVSDLRDDQGQILCSLFATAADFPKRIDKALVQIHAPITHHAAACEFTDVAPGTYAISVFHDANANGKLDVNFVGIPREGLGPRTTPGGISVLRSSIRRPFATRAVVSISTSQSRTCRAGSL